MPPVRDESIDPLLRINLNRCASVARWGGLLAALVLSGGAWGQESAVDADVVELRATIGKIVDVKAQASAEKSGWEEEKARMAELLKLYGREMALLDEELAVAGQSAESYDEAKQAAQAEIVALREVRTRVGEVVVRARKRAMALAERFPAPLLEEVEAEVAKLEAWEVGDEPRVGLQAILGMVAKAEQFNRRVRRNREVRDGQEVEVLYLGLARAYYLDRKGNAGVGVPAAGGWQWTEDKSIAGEVEKALAALDMKRPPELVELPVKILGEEETP